MPRNRPPPWWTRQWHTERSCTPTAVTSIMASSGGYVLTSGDGRSLQAANVIVAAGRWLPQLLGSLALPSSFLSSMPSIEVRQEQAYHFPYADGTDHGSSPWPTFIHKRTGWQAYGLPGGRDAGFRGQKIAEYNDGKILPSAAEQDGLIDPGNRRRAIEYVDQYFPGLVPEPYAETTCLFTNTPTEDFILDRVDGLTILSPCSGHGAKFAPLIGQLAADLATGAGLTGSRDSRRLVRGRFPAGWSERQPRPERRPCPRAAPAVSAAGGRQNPGSVPSRRDAGVPRQS